MQKERVYAAGQGSRFARVCRRAGRNGEWARRRGHGKGGAPAATSKQLGRGGPGWRPLETDERPAAAGAWGMRAAQPTAAPRGRARAGGISPWWQWWCKARDLCALCVICPALQGRARAADAFATWGVAKGGGGQGRGWQGAASGQAHVAPAIGAWKRRGRHAPAACARTGRPRARRLLVTRAALWGGEHAARGIGSSQPRAQRVQGAQGC